MITNQASALPTLADADGEVALPFGTFQEDGRVVGGIQPDPTLNAIRREIAPEEARFWTLQDSDPEEVGRKLDALGIDRKLLSGDATYSTAAHAMGRGQTRSFQHADSSGMLDLDPKEFWHAHDGVKTFTDVPPPPTESDERRRVDASMAFDTYTGFIDDVRVSHAPVYNANGPRTRDMTDDMKLSNAYERASNHLWHAAIKGLVYGGIVAGAWYYDPHLAYGLVIGAGARGLWDAWTNR